MPDRTDEQVTQQVRQNINATLGIDCQSGDSETVRRIGELRRALDVLVNTPDLRGLLDELVEMRAKRAARSASWAKAVFQVTVGAVLSGATIAITWFAAHLNNTGPHR